jgi:GNAT superfamily N-acetyltransferase
MADQDRPAAGRGVLIRPLAAADLGEADRIFRTAFGTFLGAAEPERFGAAQELIRTRWRADPAAALAAEVDGRLAGSNFAANWGSVGFFGPLTVRPELWDRAIGQRLLDATMDLFTAWGTRHAGLFTFSHSPKHVGLYQKYGFWPRFLTAVMSRPVGAPLAPVAGPGGVTRLSALPPAARPAALRAIADLTGAVYPGLDLSREISSVLSQRLGEVVLVHDGAGPQGVAVCHLGAGSEAGPGACYVKFGAVRPGPRAARGFAELVDACARLAAARGASALMAGVNAGCEQAWAALAGMGFRPAMQGVAMHRPNDDGYHVRDRYVLDDWR